MSKKTNEANVNNSNGLPLVDVLDATTTKGKVSQKFNLVDEAEAEATLNKETKNEIFSQVNDFFCPVKFDSSKLEESLQPLVISGILSEEAKLAAITKAKTQFLQENAEAIAAAQNLCFAEVVAKLQENETLYKKVLAACNISELDEAKYIENGKVAIFRANQCTDKDGNNRYSDVSLSRTENGKVFTVNLFVEYREITTDNILLAIRYYSSKQEAQKRLLNQIKDYQSILTRVAEAAKKAKENNFTKEAIFAEIEKVFAESNVDETK